MKLLRVDQAKGGEVAYRAIVNELRTVVEGLGEPAVTVQVMAMIDQMDSVFTIRKAGSYRAFVPSLLRLLGTPNKEVLKTCKKAGLPDIFSKRMAPRSVAMHSRRQFLLAARRPTVTGQRKIMPPVPALGPDGVPLLFGPDGVPVSETASPAKAELLRMKRELGEDGRPQASIGGSHRPLDQRLLGLPDGWKTSVQKCKSLSLAGRTYIRFVSPQGQKVYSARAAIKLDAENKGLDPVVALAEYDRLKEQERVFKARTKTLRKRLAGINPMARKSARTGTGTGSGTGKIGLDDECVQAFRSRYEPLSKEILKRLRQWTVSQTSPTNCRYTSPDGLGYVAMKRIEAHYGDLLLKGRSHAEVDEALGAITDDTGSLLLPRQASQLCTQALAAASAAQLIRSPSGMKVEREDGRVAPSSLEVMEVLDDEMDDAVAPPPTPPQDRDPLRDVAASMARALLSHPDGRTSLRRCVGRSLRLGTYGAACAPALLAMRAIGEALEESGEGIKFRLDHAFCCEEDAGKLDFLRQNFASPLLFSDSRELGNEIARDATSGKPTPVPVSIDIFVASFSRVDFFPSKDGGVAAAGRPSVSSSHALQGCLDFTARHKPRVVLFEMVRDVATQDPASGLRQVDIIIEALRRLGYTAGWRLLDARDYHLPRQRRRVWLWGLRHLQAAPLGNLEGELLRQRAGSRARIAARAAASGASAAAAVLLPPPSLPPPLPPPPLQPPSAQPENQAAAGVLPETPVPPCVAAVVLPRHRPSLVAFADVPDVPPASTDPTPASASSAAGDAAAGLAVAELGQAGSPAAAASGTAPDAIVQPAAPAGLVLLNGRDGGVGRFLTHLQRTRQPRSSRRKAAAQAAARSALGKRVWLPGRKHLQLRGFFAQKPPRGPRAGSQLLKKLRASAGALSAPCCAAAILSALCRCHW